MEILFQSFWLVAVAEMGDKTQLLAFLLASRYKKPWTVFAGIFVASVSNHLLAAGIGDFLANFFEPRILKWTVALIFFSFAVWILKPDKEEELKNDSHWGAFVTTTIAFFMAEMGDKTQLTTIALGMKYQSLWLVTGGTTLGMLLANGLPVFYGDKITQHMDFNLIRKVAALGFFVFGVMVLVGW